MRDTEARVGISFHFLKLETRAVFATAGKHIIVSIEMPVVGMSALAPSVVSVVGIVRTDHLSNFMFDIGLLFTHTYNITNA
jgi:hypothetical protein